MSNSDGLNQSVVNTKVNSPRGLAPLPLSHVIFLLGDKINIQNIIDSLLIACMIILSTCLAVPTDLSHQYVLEAWKCKQSLCLIL